MGKRNTSRNNKTGIKTKKSRPDQVEKLLEEWNDVFADIINTLVYNGERNVKEEYLADGPTASRFKAADGQYHEKNRDICKEDIRNGVHYAVWGMENQTDVDRLMVVRGMGYDYASYDRNAKLLQAENRLSGNEAKYTEGLPKGQLLWPVVTLVLYFGMTEWDGPTTLWELAGVPDELKRYVPNYHINLVQVAFLEENDIQKFSSDFQIIARFFRAKRLGNEQEIMYNDQRAWIHVSELMEFFYTFTGDKRYRQYKAFLVGESKKGEVKMCTLLDAFEKEGLEKGLKKGLEKGIKKGLEKGIAIGQYQIAERYARKHSISIEAAMAQLSFSKKEMSGYAAWKAADNNMA